MTEYSIGQLAAMIGMTPDTLRSYEKIRLIPRPGRDGGGRRFYTDRDISRLGFVQRAQRMGFSLDEIRQLLRFRENPAGASRKVKALAQRKYEAIEAGFRDVKRLRDEFALLLNLCSGDADSCPILESLDKGSGVETRRRRKTGPRPQAL